MEPAQEPASGSGCLRSLAHSFLEISEEMDPSSGWLWLGWGRGQERTDRRTLGVIPGISMLEEAGREAEEWGGLPTPPPPSFLLLAPLGQLDGACSQSPGGAQAPGDPIPSIVHWEWGGAWEARLLYRELYCLSLKGNTAEQLPPGQGAPPTLPFCLCCFCGLFWGVIGLNFQGPLWPGGSAEATAGEEALGVTV